MCAMFLNRSINITNCNDSVQLRSTAAEMCSDAMCRTVKSKSKSASDRYSSSCHNVGNSPSSYHHRHKHLSSCHRRCLLINLVLIITQISHAHSWSLSNLLMAGSQATFSYADTVAIGAQKGLNECGRQFTYDRWSCPESIFANVFQNSLPINREIAFVQAVISAGIVHTVTRNCSTGELDSCKCSSANENKEDAVRDGFRWGGCSDNTELGSKIAIAYLDARETGHDFKAQIRLHNNEAGRNAIKETMVRICKCHGVSGSCSLQTCWMRINEFREVGNYLKKAYRKAVKVESNDNNGLSMEKSIISVPKWKLVYSQESPDYCVAINATVGSNGILGRKCSMRKGKDVSIEERKSCRRLCKQCGYKVMREKRIVTTSCNCKFKFCCEVECQQCTKEEYTYVCSERK